ncbi:CvpA family protein [Facilibium subflavum]|uniref:CvpA family protein n=1 Tax=Facilibium subflavum TaxID=2219058 RepID=UPI0013C34E5D|nr:CvpA family protein [Facilibium subflavum]
MDTLVALNWLDWCFLAVIIIVGLFGFSQGFIKGLISLLTWLVAFILAYFFAESIKVHYTEHWFSSQEVAFWVAFFSIIVIVVIIGSILRFLLSMLKKDTQSLTDRLLGFLFGIAKAILVLSLVVGVLSYNKTVVKQASWSDSVLVPWLVKGAVWIDHKLPKEMHQKLHDNSIYNASDREPVDRDKSKVEPGNGKSAEELKAIG